MAWAPATYDVISRNHSNWSSLNLSQNVRGMNQQLLKTSGADVLTSRKKKLKKTIPVLKMTNTAKSTLTFIAGKEKIATS